MRTIARMRERRERARERLSLWQFVSHVNIGALFVTFWMDGKKDGRTDGRMDGRTDGRMDGWIDGRTNGRIDRRTDGRTNG